jgi:hypothetical protein
MTAFIVNSLHDSTHHMLMYLGNKIALLRKQYTNKILIYIVLYKPGI